MARTGAQATTATTPRKLIFSEAVEQDDAESADAQSEEAGPAITKPQPSPLATMSQVYADAFARSGALAAQESMEGAIECEICHGHKGDSR